jgi:hypothetical protein
VSPVVLLALLAAAPQQPAVSASVDRTTAAVGDVITLTIRVEAEGTAPVRIMEPVVTGLEIRGSRDVTRVSLEGGVARRTVVREVRLAATATGVATIGPVRVEREGAVAETVTITVTVTPAAGGVMPEAGVSPRLQAILDTLRPPVAGEGVMVEVLPVPPAVMLGEQLDLVTLAWFPREIRAQLRTPPTLAPPDVQGVWAYHQSTAAGVVASRRVGTRWFDLYVSHQVVFPLTAGAIAVGRATVSYVQPLSYSFLSRELQHEVQSESVFVSVAAQPGAGRPTSFSGAAGADLTVALASSHTTLPPGGAATVDVAVTGAGNVALWPEPDVAWPSGLRVYPAGVTIDGGVADGRITGTKRFRYLVIADSAGAHLVPGLSYPFFDTERRGYVVASAAGLRLVAPPGTVAAPTRPLPAPPLARGAPSLADRAAAAARWVWLVVLGVPPLLVLGAGLWRRVRGRRRARPRPDREVSALEALDRELRDALARRAGPGAGAEGPRLIAALRAAGVDPPLAQHVARVRERLHHAVFGPTGGPDPDELAAEVQEVLRALAGDAPGAERRELTRAIVVLALCVGTGVAAAQAPRPEDLYAARAFRAAADSFAARVTREPAVAAYWYNLGAAFYRLGEDGRAKAAWVRAARLAPRHADVRSALALLPGDAAGAVLVPVARWRPGEALLAGAALWCVGWLFVAFRRSRRVGIAFLAAAVAAGGAGWRLAERYREPAAIVLRDEVPLRSAPYGGAAAVRWLAAGDAVRVRRQAGAFLLVERAGGAGWVQVGEVARL